MQSSISDQIFEWCLLSDTQCVSTHFEQIAVEITLHDKRKIEECPQIFDWSAKMYLPSTCESY